MSEKIKAALTALDPKNDAHWTTDGLPRLDVMKELLGENVTREALSSVAKGFTRTSPVIETPAPWAPAAPIATPEVATAKLGDATTEEADAAEAAESLVLEELEEAKKVHEKSRLRLQLALKAYDTIVDHKEQDAKSSGGMTDIQLFQKAQAKEREGLAGRQARLKDMINNMDI
jgi:hypothetical protein